ncbi:Bestrophin-like protein [Aphelenchoides besseyi]|nr:Bestrophin-like protein [Aphelenchoides besseyi]KAI6200832.1 Bestrophin-like protein [Aphelenchoides besseyi]
MTISYEEEFSSLMLRWRGSLWKAVLKDLIAFYIAYYIILFAQWYLLDEKQKEYFTGWIHWCEIGSQYIPLSFLLGFFVAVVVGRWWEQFNYISWPDKFMMTVATCFPGPENLSNRVTLARWTSLQSAIAWTGISERTLKRFPTDRHLVMSKLMTEEEYDLFTNMDAPHGKWFVPLMWMLNLIKQEKRRGRIDSVQLQMLLDQLFKFRDGFAMLYVYDWVKIPLVYTQVVAIATYGYFFICLLGRQPKLDIKSMQTEITILFPIFTTFQMLFYVGWLKVGQFLMNPFGTDDDDFELNYVLDRNSHIAAMMAVDVADQLPQEREVAFDPQLPHTRASFKIQDIIPKSHLAGLSISNDEMKLIRPEELEEIPKQEEDKRRKKISLFNRNNKTNYGESQDLQSGDIEV